jgi:hypothetical protein
MNLGNLSVECRNWLWLLSEAVMNELYTSKLKVSLFSNSITRQRYGMIINLYYILLLYIYIYMYIIV